MPDATGKSSDLPHAPAEKGQTAQKCGETLLKTPMGQAIRTPAIGGFQRIRPRRNRVNAATRQMVAETRLDVSDLIWPVFVCEGQNVCQPIPSMKNVNRLSLDRLVAAAKQAADLGIPAIALFPAIEAAQKTDTAEEAINPDNLICRAVAALKKAQPDLNVICDVALDPYTTHGHDGLVRDGYVVNDETVAMLCHQAVVQAEAGCDILAPSDMMDGRVGAIRQSLDEAGFVNARIMSYTAKYASAFYGPFREAVGSHPTLTKAQGGFHKRGYQMDPANSHEALREASLDIAEGADMLIVKPGMPYLDILYRLKEDFKMPTFAYQVSGEYAMLTLAAEQGILDLPSAMMESLLAFKRAGADGIWTYFAIEAAEALLKR